MKALIVDVDSVDKIVGSPRLVDESGVALGKNVMAGKLVSLRAVQACKNFSRL